MNHSQAESKQQTKQQTNKQTDSAVIALPHLVPALVFDQFSVKIPGDLGYGESPELAGESGGPRLGVAVVGGFLYNHRFCCNDNDI